MVDIKKIVVLGAGLMGNGIAQVAIMAGYNVIMVDVTQEFVDKGMASINKGINRLEEKGQLTAAEVLPKLRTSLDLASAVKDADMVIEAVVERMDVKKEVCKTTMDNGPSHIIYASNTSTMDITEIGEDCGAPERVSGMHFFNPVPLMRCIEVIRGDKTSDETFQITMDVAKSLPCLRGERYIAPVLKSRPGFIVNRLNAPVGIYGHYIRDLAYEKGIPWEQLDADYAVLKPPMLPGVLSDYVGIDTSYYGALYYVEKLSPDFKPGKVITMMFNEKKLGRKTGQGFYDWSEGRPTPDTSIKAGLVDFDIIAAIRMNEGCRLLEEGVVKSYNVIDEANMAGMNTPGPFARGKDRYKELVKRLEEFVALTGKTYLTPCETFKSGKFLEMA